MTVVKSKPLSDEEWAIEFAKAFRRLTETVQKWTQAQQGWEFLGNSNKTLHDKQDVLQIGAPCEIVVPPFRAPKSRDEFNTPLSHKGGTLVLEPKGRDWAGNGSVDFYAWPAMYSVSLLNNGETGQWRVFTESGIPWRREWNEENFVLLAHDLLAAGK